MALTGMHSVIWGLFVKVMDKILADEKDDVLEQQDGYVVWVVECDYEWMCRVNKGDEVLALCYGRDAEEAACTAWWKICEKEDNDAKDDKKPGA